MNTDQIKKILPSIEEALQKLRYGAIEITVHNSQVVQFELKEKVRFDKNND